MRPALKYSAIAFSVATLCLLPVLTPLASPRHIAVYHLAGPSAAIFVPALLDLLGLWLLLLLLLQLARTRPRLRTATWALLIFPLPWVLLKDWSALFEIPIPHALSLLLVMIFLGLIVAFSLTRNASALAFFERLRRFMEVIYGFLTISSLLLFLQFGWCAWQARAIDRSPPLHQRVLSNAPPASPRIVWILFDELSHDQIYAHRYPGLQLPAFDRLAATSTVFTNVEPTSIWTQQAIPSLLTGLPASQIHVAADGLLHSLVNPATGAPQPFDQHNTIFQDALNLGYGTAVAGWYNPYCRILPDVLDQCFWTRHSLLAGAMRPYGSIPSNTFTTPLRFFKMAAIFADRGLQSRADMATEQQAHLLDLTQIAAAADKQLLDPGATFIFLHFPIPHPPGIYDRTGATWTDSSPSTYIDNLALADRELAHIRSLLEQQGTWDASTILVMGDHSWRGKQIWSNTPGWSVEEQQASRTGYDDRPAYIVKLPHQLTAASIDPRFPAIATRAMLQAIMSRRISSPQDLRAWTERPR